MKGANIAAEVKCKRISGLQPDGKREVTFEVVGQGEIKKQVTGAWQYNRPCAQ